jgi:hypothetical protein
MLKQNITLDWELFLFSKGVVYFESEVLLIKGVQISLISNICVEFEDVNLILYERITSNRWTGNSLTECTNGTRDR